jgi:hypothetical protein
MSSPLSSTSPAVRRTVGSLLALVASLLLVTGTAGSASAEDGYRYWNYSHLTGGDWEFAQTGPGDFTPKDGDVEGWRFGTSTVSQGISPRADLDKVTFDAVCEGAKAASGEKRVAVLVDFGTEADAQGAEVPEPRGECAVVPQKATGQQVLESVVDVRSDQGMTCALDGYPAKGCGDPVSDADVPAKAQSVAFQLPAAADMTGDGDADTTAAAAKTDDGQNNGWLLLGAGALVVVLAGVAVPLYRRNRDA